MTREKEDGNRPSLPAGQVPERALPDSSYFDRFGLTKLPRIHCGNKDCGNELHCFYYYESSRIHNEHDRGSCQGCGVTLVDWQRVQNVDLSRIDEKFAQMKSEWIRHYYWHCAFDEEALRLAHYRGRLELERQLRGALERGIMSLNPIWDRRQTPYKDDIKDYIRHATASCC